MPQVSLEPIRQAVSSGEFERANLLWNDAAAGLSLELSNACLSAERLQEVRELVEWSRTVVLCERTHLLDQLNKLQEELRMITEYEHPSEAAVPRIMEASF